MGVLNSGCLLPRRGEERREDRKNKACIRGCGQILKMGGTRTHKRTHALLSTFEGIKHKGNRVNVGCGGFTQIANSRQTEPYILPLRILWRNNLYLKSHNQIPMKNNTAVARLHLILLFLRLTVDY